MGKTLLAIVGGYVTWTVVFLGGSAGLRTAFADLHDAAGSTDSLGLLLGYLVLSFVASLAAGYLAGRLAPRLSARRDVLILAVLLLATGVPVQIGVWDTLPVWYHLLFLVGLVPLTLLGGRWARPRR